ncbi:unnamed protein product, partial [Prorocentrum cordatum]
SSGPRHSAAPPSSSPGPAAMAAAAAAQLRAALPHLSAQQVPMCAGSQEIRTRRSSTSGGRTRPQPPTTGRDTAGPLPICGETPRAGSGSTTGTTTACSSTKWSLAWPRRCPTPTAPRSASWWARCGPCSTPTGRAPSACGSSTRETGSGRRCWRSSATRWRQRPPGPRRGQPPAAGHGPSRPAAQAPRPTAAPAAGPQEQLQELFPSLPPARIREALARCRGDKAAAADWLARNPAAQPVVQGRPVVQAQPAQALHGAAPAAHPCAPRPPAAPAGGAGGGHAAGGAAAAPPSRGAPRLTGRKRAVLIGINYFGTQAQLRGCINDVRSMQSLLEQMGWPRNCMRTLTDDQRGPSMPTRANIEAALRWLVEGVQPGDVLFFHFSGHGAQQEDPHGYEEDGMNETILPVDFKSAGMMTDDLLGELTVRRLPEGVRLTAVMDCCHSGTGLDLPYSWMGRGWKEDTNPYHTLGDVQMFSGCADDDTSADAATAYGAAGGAMTTAFCDVLRSNPGLPYSSLIQQLNNTMARRGFSQRAQLTSSQAFDFSRPFLLEDIIPNSNRTIGRTFRRKFPPRPRRMEGPLADMLGIGMAVMGGMMLGDLAGGLLGAFL